MKDSVSGFQKNRWLSSLEEFRSLRTVTFCGVMCALSIILSTVASIRIGPYVKIGLSGLPNQIVDFMYGPAAGAIFSGALEIIKYVLKPDGPYFFGFTLSSVIAGAIYGSILYRRPLTIWRVLAAQVLVKAVVNLGLNTLWLVILYHKAVWVLFPARLTTNLIRLPGDVIVMYLMLKAVERTILPLFASRRGSAAV